jgi:hypothetical protein
MTLSRTSRGDYIYFCPRRPANVTAESQACPYGEQNIRAYIVNAEGVEALGSILARRADLARLLEARIAGTKDETLERVTASLQEMAARKKEDRDKYLVGIGAAKDPSIITALVEKAEKLAAEIRDAEAQIAEARPRLDSLQAQRGQFEYVLHRLDGYVASFIYATEHSVPPTPPTVGDKRFLMDLIGLRLEGYPVGVLPDTERLVVSGSERTTVFVPRRIVIGGAIKGDPQFSGAFVSISA